MKGCFALDFASDSLSRKFTILPERFKLFANSKHIILREAYVDHKKTRFAIEASIEDSIGGGLKMFLLADSAIICNGQSMIKKDTLRFEIIPR